MNLQDQWEVYGAKCLPPYMPEKVTEMFRQTWFASAYVTCNIVKLAVVEGNSERFEQLFQEANDGCEAIAAKAEKTVTKKTTA